LRGGADVVFAAGGVIRVVGAQGGDEVGVVGWVVGFVVDVHAVDDHVGAEGAEVRPVVGCA